MTEKQQQNTSHCEDFNQRFEEFYKETQDQAYRYARSLSVDSEAAEDMVQEAFLRIYARLRDNNNYIFANFNSYLYTIIRNMYYDRARRESRQRIMNSIEMDEILNEIVDPNTPEQLIEDAERQDVQRTAILNAFSTLSTGEKRVLALHLNGHIISEIAERLHIPLNTAKSRLLRSKQHVIERARHELQSYMDA
jgi:RNA polymerase sigma factor (sigma-70 family)